MAGRNGSERRIKRWFGWNGIYKEEKAFDQLTRDSDCFVEYAAFAEQEHRAEKEFVNRARSKMPFDAGWCFWHGVDQVFGAQLPPGPQDCGNCVGYSAALSVADLMADEIYFDGDLEEAFVPYCPWQYGSGRIYIGGGRLGRGDGSLGSWQIESDTKYGVLPSDLDGLRIKDNEPAEPDAKTTRAWGSKRAILDQWKDKAAPFKIKYGTRIKNADQAKEAIVELRRPLTIASNWGFRKKGFDSRYGMNIFHRSGSWAHQMHIRAIFERKGAWFCYVGNQWGRNAHGKVAEGFPLGGFVITLDLLDRWLRDAACYARGGFQGRKAELGTAA